MALSRAFLPAGFQLPTLCPLCDCPHMHPQPLCHYCRRLLLQELHETPVSFRAVEGILICSLFVWEPKSSLGVIPEILYAVKGGKNKILARYLVELFLIRHSINQRKPRTLIPAPSLKPGGEDHALVLLRGFSEHLPSAIEFSPLLRGQGRQRSRGLSERKKSKMQFSRKRVRRYCRFRDRAPIVFIDDVVTSGATLTAAWKALGKPSGFSCWCLADRRREV